MPGQRRVQVDDDDAPADRQLGQILRLPEAGDVIGDVDRGHAAAGRVKTPRDEALSFAPSSFG
jgi:hypothetical protein